MIIRETNCTIHWIAIYPVDSAIHLLDNWGLVTFVLNAVLKRYFIISFCDLPFSLILNFMVIK